jgi:hypothetical protein
MIIDNAEAFDAAQGQIDATVALIDALDPEGDAEKQALLDEAAALLAAAQTALQAAITAAANGDGEAVKAHLKTCEEKLAAAIAKIKEALE